jgi:GDP-4-dehydro-6-deoxy-D-mannose reductase
VDVRDVVRAYYLLLKKGKKGEIYNVCSGDGISLQEILGKMTKIADVQIRQISEKAFFRPDDNRIIIGSNEKINKDVGWVNEIKLDTSLKDVLAFFLAR